MNERKVQLIIPMSGIGKRFIDAGYKDPKPLIIVDRKPIIQHVVEMFGSPDDVIFICNEIHVKNTNVVEILRSISKNCKIISVSNENRKGPVDAVSKIYSDINDTDEVIVSYCDYGTVWDYQGFLKYVKDTDSDACIPCYTGFHPHMLGSDNYAFVKMDGDKAVRIQEKKPFTDNKMNELASNGAYYFKNGKILKHYFSKLIELGECVNNEFYVSMVNNLLIDDGLKVTTFLIDKMLQWGTPYDLEIYKGWSNLFFKQKYKPLKQINNPPNTAMILPMAGKGSRFSEQGYEIPKPLLPVNGKPMILNAVNCLPKSQNNVFVCLKEHTEKYDLDNILLESYKNANVVFLDEVTEGQACTCKLAIDKCDIELSNPIFISACDNGVYYNTEKYQKLLNDKSVDVIVWTFRNNQTSKISPNSYAWLDVDENDNVKHVSCKKFIYDDPLKIHAIIGSMFFRKAEYFTEGLQKNIEENIRTNNEFYVDDVLNQNIKSGLNVKVFEVEHYICWGTPNDYKTYNYWESHFNS